MRGRETFIFLANRRFAVAVSLAVIGAPHAFAQQNASQATAAAQGQQVNDLQAQISAVVLQQATNAAQLPLPNVQLQLGGA